MRPIRSLLLAAAASLALVACATPADDNAGNDNAANEPDRRAIPEKPPYPEPVSPAPSNPGEEAMSKCSDKDMAWAKGQLADEPMVSRIRQEAHAKGVRVIKPGMAVTMDYREDRVNIEVDAENRVVLVRCG